MKCCILSCKSYSDKRSDAMNGITFHSFPSDEKLKNKWISQINRSNWVPTKFTRICSCHFNNEDFIITKKGLKRLNKGAFPRLMLNISVGDTRESPEPTTHSPEPGPSAVYLKLNISQRNKVLEQQVAQLRYKVKADRLKIKRLQKQVSRLKKKVASASKKKL